MEGLGWCLRIVPASVLANKRWGFNHSSLIIILATTTPHSETRVPFRPVRSFTLWARLDATGQWQ